MQAVNRGEPFDTDAGLPDSMIPKEEEVTWLSFVQRYVMMKWPSSAAKSRDSMTDALSTVTPVLVADVAGRPPVDHLRRVLRECFIPPVGRDLGAIG
jgi:hypothetical protein